jgi:hypothetical protein
MVVKFGLSILDSDPFEKLHIKFIKEILGIHCKASNDGCRAELNRTPLKSKILFSIFNFMNHIIYSKNTFVYDIYIKSRETNPWVEKVKKLIKWPWPFKFLHHK